MKLRSSSLLLPPGAEPGQIGKSNPPAPIPDDAAPRPLSRGSELSKSRLKYHDSGREKHCHPQVGQWNMMNKFKKPTRVSHRTSPMKDWLAGR